MSLKGKSGKPTSWHEKRQVRTWKITFYIGKQVYDVEYYQYNRKPVQFAGYGKGLATHFEIEEIT